MGKAELRRLDNMSLDQWIDVNAVGEVSTKYGRS